jgi:DNA repair exonuclease SbcCD ATPase subunit
MNDQERRTEILKAEEAIRQLSAELSLASEARTQASRAEAALTAVKGELADVRRTLDDAASRMSGAVSAAHASVSEAATTTLADATARLDEAMEQLPGAVSRLESATTLIAEMPDQTAEAVKLELSTTTARLIEVSSSMKALAQLLADIRQTLSTDLEVKLREIAGMAKSAVFFAAVAALAAIVAAIVRFL